MSGLSKCFLSVTNFPRSLRPERLMSYVRVLIVVRSKTRLNGIERYQDIRNPPVEEEPQIVVEGGDSE
jgi:hypothetical protein